jgi:hypothetical protein
MVSIKLRERKIHQERTRRDLNQASLHLHDQTGNSNAKLEQFCGQHEKKKKKECSSKAKAPTYHELKQKKRLSRFLSLFSGIFLLQHNAAASSIDFLLHSA